MERSNRRDLPVILGSVVALIVTGAVIYGAVDAATLESTLDTNTPNGTTQGPPASFEER